MGNESVVELRRWRIEHVLRRGNVPADIVNGAVDQAAGDLRSGVHRQLVARETFQASVQLVIHEDAVGVAAFAAHVVHAVAIAGEGAIPQDRAGFPEGCHNAVVGERSLARGFRNWVFAGVGDVPDEQTIDNAGGASRQQINRRAGALRAISEEHAILNQDRVLLESLMLDGDARAARATEVVHDFNVSNRWVGPSEDFDCSAIGVEEVVLKNSPVRLYFPGPILRHEAVRAGDPKTLQHRIGGNSVAKIDDMIDHRWEPEFGRKRQLRIGGSQCDRADRFESDAIVHFVEPDQSLSLAVRSIFAGVNFDDLSRFVGCRLLQGVLDVVARINVIAIL